MRITPPTMHWMPDTKHVTIPQISAAETQAQSKQKSTITDTE